MKKPTTQRNESTVVRSRGVSAFEFLHNLGTFDSFRISGFRFYFFSMVGQWMSMNMQITTRSLLIYRLSGSATILGVMALANAIPSLLFSLLGGALADRMRKKYVIQVGQVAGILVAISVAVALSTGYLSPQRPGSWWILLVTSAFQGVVMAFVMPSRQAIISELVSKEKLMNAMALNNLGTTTLQLISPAVAGFLIDGFGFATVYYVMAGLLILAIIFTTFIPLTGVIARHPSNALVTVKEGLKYIWNKPTLFLVLVFGIIFTLLSMPINMMMPIFADDILKVGASGMGMLMSVSGAGALVASLVLASLPSRKRGIILLAGSLFLSIGLVAFAFSKWWSLSLGLMIVIGMGRATHMTAATTLFQTLPDREYVGRVVSVAGMIMGLSSLGTFFAGILAESVGVQWSIGGFAMALTLLTVLVLQFLPRIRNLD